MIKRILITTFAVVFVIIGSFPVQAQTVALQYCADFNSLAVYWLENISNQVPSGNPLINHNGVTFSIGNFNNAANFGSTNSTKYLDTGPGVGIGWNGGNVTISLWVKISTEPINESFRLAQLIDSTTTDTMLELRYADIAGSKTLEFGRTRIGIQTVNFTSPQILGTTNWHHVVATYNSSTGLGTLYLDNVNLGTFSQTGNGNFSGAGQTNNFVVGVFIDGNNLPAGGFLKGLVDEVVVDSTVWDSTKINAVKTRLNPPIGCSSSGTSNLDVPLSTRNAEATQLLIKAKTDNLSNLDILLSSLRDAITAPSPNNKTLKDLFDKLQSILNQLDVALSTRASESTLVLAKGVLDSIKAKTDNLDVLLSSRAGETTQLLVKSTLDAIKAKTDNLDVLLSSRASELTLQGVKAGTDKLDTNISTRASEATLQVLLGGTLWQRRSFEGKGFIVTTNEITVASAAETDFILIKNPAASGKLHRANQLTVTVRTNGQNVRLRIYKNPTITTNGNPLAVNNVRTTGNTPVTLTFSLPSIFSRGQLIVAYSRNADSLDRPFNLSLYLEQGESYLITVQGTATGNDYMFTYTFVEE